MGGDTQACTCTQYVRVKAYTFPNALHCFIRHMEISLNIVFQEPKTVRASMQLLYMQVESIDSIGNKIITSTVEISIILMIYARQISR